MTDKIHCETHGLMGAQCCMCVHKSIAELERKLAVAREALEDLYMNTSTSMPATYNDEASWYRSQLHSVIGRAARAHKELTE